MKNNRKIKIEILLAVIFFIILVFWPKTSEAATYGDLTYEVGVGHIKITGLANENVEEIYIPNMISSYHVTDIADNAFENCVNLKKVKSETIAMYIGEKAFYGCTNLESVDIKVQPNFRHTNWWKCI